MIIRIFLLSVLVAPLTTNAEDLAVDSLPLRTLSSGWGKPQPGKSISGGTLKVAGKTYDRGIGTHAPSSLLLSLDGKADKFEAMVGIDDYAAADRASVEFKLIGDGKELWASGILKGGRPAVKCEADLSGVRSLQLVVTDGGNGTDSDHANWLTPVISYQGTPPVEWAPPSPVEDPGAPPNVGLVRTPGSGVLTYDGHPLLTLPQGATISAAEEKGARDTLTQTLKLKLPAGATLAVRGSREALAAETRGPAQQAFPFIRTAHGDSSNLRNNAIYDRSSDWMLEAGPGTRIVVATDLDGTKRFTLTPADGGGTLTFRPRYFQKHRNLAHYQPWTYQVRKDSITGWCSWWAFMRDANEKNVEELLKVWEEKRFADYGYRFIQLDDAYQGRYDGQREHAKNHVMYQGGTPDTWLDWKDNFPSGLDGYSGKVRKAGFQPALWIGCFFSDNATARQHPDWFVQGADGLPFPSPWASYGVDTTNPEAADTLVRPTFRGLKDAGLSYLKIDQLRHMLYDNFHHNPQWFASKGIGPADLFRNYLRIAREELGRDTFILSCWGVLPESIGLADACRIGGDGYGPVTLQQYNSFNGLVWLNDPDHCDILPQKAAAEAGNVRETKEVAAVSNDTIIRPALASIAGAMLMLSDAPAVYRDEKNLVGLRKSSPVISSVPAQLYDFDPVKTDVLRDTERMAIQSGTSPSPIDGDQFGKVCPFWLNEFNTGFDRWNVLHRLNWSNDKMPPARVSFGDLGLDPAKTYIVHEFWSDTTLGITKDGFELPGLDAMGLQSYAIREAQDHPQLISTNRHLSQGAAEIEALGWDQSTLTLEGRSRIIAEDDYRLLIHIPTGFRALSATADRQTVPLESKGNRAMVTIKLPRTGSTAWTIRFEKAAP
ncbi:NPCBM/NEW2 domain-containing protein [Luteolibacter luteus]|uniref:Glycosyl hydrolase family 98 putative carbohydrate-binding module domain-containing protein n=1 Tax=Luteolibacter luteus TaxID=2728835 RepID=A0A858RBI3_9BACT|nr:NPCBM/NEW2 domain-containing protein [Luteolibacter luteus]QJE94356.1 hypothetical protein HHL09_00665 [Luteolibacter luteus]